jgi:integrase/recombinase XerD
MKHRLPWEITTDMLLSDEETHTLLRHVRRRAQSASPKPASARLDQLIIEVLLFSGIRNSEFCKLTLGDFKMEEDSCTLRVRGTGKENRTVHLPKAVGTLLSRYITESRPQSAPTTTKIDAPGSPLVFNERRKPFERTGLYRRVTRILAEAGLAERASVQLLRHTYGYLAYKHTGGNLLFVQRQLGHAHPMITSVYARLVDESYEHMANCVYAPCGGSAGTPKP